MSEKTKKSIPYYVVGFVLIAVAIGLLLYFYGESCRDYENYYLIKYEILQTSEKLSKFGYFFAEYKGLIFASLLFVIPGLLCFKAADARYAYNQELGKRIDTLNTAKQYYSVGRYTSKGNTINISQRSKLFSDVLEIKDYTVSDYTYNEEKIHVGAVTVGGVTTGGMYKTGGNYSVRSHKSGRKSLCFNYVETGKKIDSQKIATIVLSKELAKQAKKSTIAEYLNGDAIEVVINVPVSVAGLALAKTGDFSIFGREIALGQPSQEKCEAIINWLSEE